ncbi:hypothetical protein BTM25_10470 [Actinomadura rubteroloni]|uniref:DUF5666 domain-containing protein n=1 Tax=Actinomadura rubteroloni TaxID=1926885 RepID=A0A2P4UNL0_9ACTN|nr:hypothetical protein [Actinomadura rubteroloni]POM26644.1 hypothetical protein BTM25_10470 [Actinomadura rubteroloni]
MPEKPQPGVPYAQSGPSVPGPPASDAELLATSPFEDDLDDALAAVPPRRALPGPTLYLAAGVLLVVGFLGGVQAQKWNSGTSAGTPSAQPGRALPGGYGAGARGGYGGGYGGAPGARGGFGGGLTAGTVTKVSGDTLWVKTADGKTVKVQTGGSTRVSVTREGSLKDLGAGTSVVVRGSAGDDGTVTATQVTEGGRPGGGN